MKALEERDKDRVTLRNVFDIAKEKKGQMRKLDDEGEMRKLDDQEEEEEQSSEESESEEEAVEVVEESLEMATEFLAAA